MNRKSVQIKKEEQQEFIEENISRSMKLSKSHFGSALKSKLIFFNCLLIIKKRFPNRINRIKF